MCQASIRPNSLFYTRASATYISTLHSLSPTRFVLVELTTTGSTSLSLVRRVQQGDAASWDRFALLYVPLVYYWCRRDGLQDTDARDVCQNVFLSVSQKVQSFQPERQGATLRGWLRAITRNAIVDFQRRQGRQVAALDESHPAWDELTSVGDESSALLNPEWAVVVQQAAEVVQREVGPATWLLFCHLVLEGRSAAEIAPQHGITVWGVYKARTRVLAKFRELLGELL